MVIDARTGQVFYETNADSRLHPASLTKMMTLYIAFEAIKRGEISLDTMVTISANAAAEPPSKLGLRAGQKIKLRYLIRAAAIKSANDAATAIGDAISGNEAAFARRMNRTAKALGMTRTTFKNANGLTRDGHLSTARDMTTLGRRLFYDHPEYYNLFSRRSSDAGGRTVTNTNRKFLDAYRGADGIKTGYTRAAGFNLVASAERGDERIIATVFGGTSTAARNAKVAELLDRGFSKAPSRARVKKLPPPVYADNETTTDKQIVVAGTTGRTPVASAKTIRVSGAVSRSLFPRPRPGPEDEAPAPELLAEMQGGIQDALAAVIEAEERAAAALGPTDAAPTTAAIPPPRPKGLGRPEAALADEGSEPDAEMLAEAAADGAVDGAEDGAEPIVMAADALPSETIDRLGAVVVPRSGPDTAPAGAEVDAADPDADPILLARANPEQWPASALVADRVTGPLAIGATDNALDSAPDVTHPVQGQVGRPVLQVAALPAIEPETFAEAPRDLVVVTRLSSSGGRQWSVNVGTYRSQFEAERVLLQTALRENGTLEGSLRKVARTQQGFRANFLGLSEDMAKLACLRLSARGAECLTIGPEG